MSGAIGVVRFNERRQQMPVDYDAISSAYASSRSANRGVVDELLAHVTLGTESKVLEVGCGTADHIAALIDACGCNGWGVEPSAGMRGHAPTIDRLQLVAGTAEAIPFAAGFFDFIFTSFISNCFCFIIFFEKSAASV